MHSDCVPASVYRVLLFERKLSVLKTEKKESLQSQRDYRQHRTDQEREAG